jgi:hypothetical protein
VEDVARVIFYATDPLTTGLDGNKIKTEIEKGIAEWTANLPLRMVERLGIPLATLAAAQAATVAKPDQPPT